MIIADIIFLYRQVVYLVFELSGDGTDVSKHLGMVQDRILSVYVTYALNWFRAFIIKFIVCSLEYP